MFLPAPSPSAQHPAHPQLYHLFFISGLKASQPSIPRSKTSDDIPEYEACNLTPPTLVSRTQSVGNLATNSSQKPVPAPRRDSLEKDTDADSGPKPQPRPAPRRNVQSCVLGADYSIAPPTTAPRPMSAIGRGELPPLPKCQPESSQNYYASVVDTNTIDPRMASVLLNGSDANNVKSNETVDSQPTIENIENSEYETIWGQELAPMVPKRRDVSEDSSLLDKPLSPQHAKPDPFDTSAVKPLLPSSVPLMPTTSGTEVRNGHSPLTITEPILPSIPPRPKPDNQVLAEFDSLCDFGGGGATSYQAPPSSPPPSPPTSSPDDPPLPPPRVDLPMCNNELENNSTPPANLQGPPVAVRKNVGGDSTIAPPPIPARPPVTFDTELTNQEAGFMETPPIPARPAPPPPVPKRPAV